MDVFKGNSYYNLFINLLLLTLFFYCFFFTFFRSGTTLRQGGLIFCSYRIQRITLYKLYFFLLPISLQPNSVNLLFFFVDLYEFTKSVRIIMKIRKFEFVASNHFFWKKTSFEKLKEIIASTKNYTLNDSICNNTNQKEKFSIKFS